jgi:competence protein ComEA
MPLSEQNMKTDRPLNLWALAVILLSLVIIAGGVFVLVSARNNPGVEISLAEPQAIQGNIYVSGAVNNPGIYPIYTGDSLDDLIRAAGGIKDGGDLADIKLSIAAVDTINSSQKININRAEAWLLEALPGVGEVKARAVIAYREQRGFFHDINELLNVPGFGESSLAEIKDYITVYD